MLRKLPHFLAVAVLLSAAAADSRTASGAQGITYQAASGVVSPATSHGFGAGLARSWRQSLQSALEVGSIDSFESSSAGMNYRQWLEARANRAVEGLAGGTLDYFGQYLTGTGTDGRPRFGFIRTVDWDFSTELAARRWQAGVSALGPLHETEDGAFVWQLRGYLSDEEARGANLGLIYRHALAGTLLGGNVFLDYERHGETEEEFLRYSLGAEVRTELIDLHANRYAAATDSSRDEPEKAYTRDGFDVGLQGQISSLRWLSGGLEYYTWTGEYGDADEKGLRYNIALTPVLGAGHRLRVEVEYDDPEDGDGEWGGQLSYQYVPEGARRAGSGKAFDPRAHFFDPVRREYAQRISVPTGAYVFEATGTTHYCESQDRIISAGDAVDYIGGACVQTQAASTLGLRVSNAWTLTLFANTEVHFQLTGTQLSLELGTLYLNRRSGPTTIVTPNATIALLGTAVSVSYDDVTGVGVAEVNVMEGRASISTPDPINVKIACVSACLGITRNDETYEPGFDEISIPLIRMTSGSGQLAEGTIALLTVQAADDFKEATTITISSSDHDTDWNFFGGCRTNGGNTCAIEFEASEDSKIVTITAMSDSFDEDSEVATVAFEAPPPAGYRFGGDFRFTIAANRTPVWEAVPEQIALFGAAFTLDLNDHVRDPDGETYTCSVAASTLPAGFALGGASSCVLSSPPVTASTGQYILRVLATDTTAREAETAVTVNVTVGQVSFSAVGAIAAEGETALLTVQANPPFNGVTEVTFSSPNSGDWNFAAGCRNNGGNTCAIEFTEGLASIIVALAAVSDSDDEDSEVATISFDSPPPAGYQFGGDFEFAIAANRPPVWGVVPTLTVTVNSAFSHDLAMYVTEPDGEAYTCSDPDNTLRNTGFTLGGASTCVLAADAGSATTGDYTLRVLATDTPTGKSAEATVTVIVADQAQISFSAAGATVAEGDIVLLTVLANPRFDDATTVTISSSGDHDTDWNFFGGCRTNGNTCAIEFEETDDSKIVSLTVMIDDEDEDSEEVALAFEAPPPAGYEFSGDFRLTIAANNKPVWDAVPPQTVSFDEALSLELATYVTEPDREAYTCSATLTGFALGGASTCLLSLPAGAASAGQHILRVLATDLTGREAETAVTVNVIGQVSFSAAGAIAAEGETALLTVQANPPFNGVTEVTFSSPNFTGDWNFAAGCQTNDGNTCAIEFTAGLASIIVTLTAVSDSDDEDNEVATISFDSPPPAGYQFGGDFEFAIAANRPPVWGVVPPLTVAVNSDFSHDLTIYVTEPDGEAYTCSDPDNTLRNTGFSLGGASTCVLAADAGSATTGDYTLRVLATDTPTGKSAEGTVTVMVADRGEISFTAAGSAAAEGETALLTVLANPAFGAAAAVTVSSSDHPGDWNFLGGCRANGVNSCIIDFALGEASKVVTVTAVTDSETGESTEVVRLNFAGTPPDNYRFGAGHEFTVFSGETGPPVWDQIPLQVAYRGSAFATELSIYVRDPDGDQVLCWEVRDTLRDKDFSINTSCSLSSASVTIATGKYNWPIAASDTTLRSTTYVQLQVAEATTALDADLIRAAREGSAAELRAALAGANVNAVTPDGMSVLDYANQRVATVRAPMRTELLAAGAECNVLCLYSFLNRVPAFSSGDSLSLTLGIARVPGIVAHMITLQLSPPPGEENPFRPFATPEDFSFVSGCESASSATCVIAVGQNEESVVVELTATYDRDEFLEEVWLSLAGSDGEDAGLYNVVVLPATPTQVGFAAADMTVQWTETGVVTVTLERGAPPGGVSLTLTVIGDSTYVDNHGGTFVNGCVRNQEELCVVRFDEGVSMAEVSILARFNPSVHIQINPAASVVVSGGEVVYPGSLVGNASVQFATVRVGKMLFTVQIQNRGPVTVTIRNMNGEFPAIRHPALTLTLRGGTYWFPANTVTARILAQVDFVESDTPGNTIGEHLEFCCNRPLIFEMVAPDGPLSVFIVATDIPIQVAQKDDPYDLDLNDFIINVGSAYRCESVSGLIGGLIQRDPNNCVLSTPSLDVVSFGDYEIAFTAAKGSERGTATITLRVTSRPPTWMPPVPLQRHDIGSTVTVDLNDHLDEPDGNAYECEFVGSPSHGLALGGENTCELSSASFTGSPGSFVITVRATDTDNTVHADMIIAFEAILGLLPIPEGGVCVVADNRFKSEPFSGAGVLGVDGQDCNSGQAIRFGGVAKDLISRNSLQRVENFWVGQLPLSGEWQVQIARTYNSNVRLAYIHWLDTTTRTGIRIGISGGAGGLHANIQSFNDNTHSFVLHADPQARFSRGFNPRGVSVSNFLSFAIRIDGDIEEALDTLTITMVKVP